MTNRSNHPTFRNRYMICGRLTLISDLHLGDGGERERAASRGGEERAAQVATVARTPEGFPVIPGAALKGVLRSYLEQVLVDVDREQLEQLFGWIPLQAPEEDAPDASYGAGGRVHVEYALPVSAVGLNTVTNVGIDRLTRVPADRILFARDVVPAGTKFNVSLTGYDLDEEAGDLELLLSALEGFHDEHQPIRLGGGSSDHEGRASWELSSVRVLAAPQVGDWLNQRRPGMPFESAVSWDANLRQSRVETAAKRRTEGVSRRRPVLTLTLRLKFLGPFVVDDPDADAPTAHSGRQPDHAPRLTADRRPLLPASSFRGAFRSQAERIARTLDPLAIGDPHRVFPNRRPGDYYPLEQLFGAAGLAAAIECEPFVGVEPIKGELPFQQFVAIDRFTGGSAEKKLFSAAYVWKPTLQGRIHLRLDRIPPWLTGLLALTFRDLIEGDITFGFGAAKGYGACRAEIVNVSVQGLATLLGQAEPDSHGDLLWRAAQPGAGTSSASDADRVNQIIAATDFRNPATQSFINACVALLRKNSERLHLPVATNP